MAIDFEKLYLEVAEAIDSMSDEELHNSLLECGLKLEPPKDGE